MNYNLFRIPREENYFFLQLLACMSMYKSDQLFLYNNNMHNAKLCCNSFFCVLFHVNEHRKAADIHDEYVKRAQPSISGGED